MQTIEMAADTIDPDTVEVLDRGFLALDGVLASDLAVVNGARVSFNSTSDEWTERDGGLIRFLMRDHHGSPFEHGYFRFIVKAPIFVVREHHRHRAGHSYNEWSGRYSKMEAEFYVPDFVRSQVGKPGAYTFEPVEPEVREQTRKRDRRRRQPARSSRTSGCSSSAWPRRSRGACYRSRCTPSTSGAAIPAR